MKKNGYDLHKDKISTLRRKLPVFLYLNLGASTEATFPRRNYKKANCTLFKHRTSTLATETTMQGRDINMVAKEFNSCILKVAQETIRRGKRRNYCPY